MPRQLWIADALRNAGLHVIEQPGWKDRGASTFDPRGVVCHHTASNAKGGDIPSLNVVIKGRPDLPGPLCHVLIGRSGACHTIAAGRANHAGTGGWKGLTGNVSVLGIEAENDGIGEPWPAPLVDVFERCAAALAKGCLAPAGMVCGHKEWTPRKIDPAGIDMAGFRAAVAQLMQPGPQPPPKDVDMEAEFIIDLHRAYFGLSDPVETWSKVELQSFDYHLGMVLGGQSRNATRLIFAAEARRAGRI